MTPPKPPGKDWALPPVREDVHVMQGAPTPDGTPTWTIHDPVRNKYYQIGWMAYQLLSRWNCGSSDRLVKALNSETTHQVSKDDVEDLVKFLYANSLTRDPATGTSQAFVEQVEGQRQHWLKWLIHHYLFIRIPLVRPDRFLRATLPIVAPVYTKTMGWLVILLGVIGVYLVGQQWETFTNTFLYFFTWEGVLVYGLAFGFVKILHELGHAYTATRYGCRVPTMGIVFMVMFPMMYTDTTDVWRLTSRRQRFFVSAAGTIMELALAMLATFAWNFLPPGVLQSVAFVLATTSWVMGLTINLNPLLRFDGYYVLSDWLGVENLQDRSFAFGSWKLRQVLFGIDAPPPVQVSSSLRKKLIVYAWTVWVFRFFLFLGIALLVYHLFFKLLGLFLFVVEILWFIVLPIAREVKVWWNIRSAITRTSRFWVTAFACASLVALVFVPWVTRVSIPAVLETAQHATIYAPTPGRIVERSIEKGQLVTQGEVLFTLEAPALDSQIVTTKRRMEILKVRARRQAVHPEELANIHVVSAEFNALSSELKGILEKRNNLVLRAPISGMVADIADSLHPGRWVNEKLPLAFLVNPNVPELHALIPETELVRVEAGKRARFIPDDLSRPSIQAQVQEVRQVEEGTFEVPYLASTFGGEIPVRLDERGELQSESSVYGVKLHVLGKPPMVNQAIRGIIH
ncbi:MAG: HlyD family efflux transporter periplasmic adaptor subunit, partial [Candidatus Binatia bacterium]